MPANSSEYDRGYRAGRKDARIAQTAKLSKINKEFEFLRKKMEILAQETPKILELLHFIVDFLRKTPAPPYMNLPTEDEESLSLRETGLKTKSLKTCLPDSSLPASARANGYSFYPNLAEAAAAFKKKGLGK